MNVFSQTVEFLCENEKKIDLYMIINVPSSGKGRSLI